MRRDEIGHGKQNLSPPCHLFQRRGMQFIYDKVKNDKLGRAWYILFINMKIKKMIVTFHRIYQNSY